MDVLAYAKQHPVTTGAIVIGGGLVFILLSGWFSGGSASSSGGSSGPSDAVQAAQIQAEAQLQGAQISAGAAAAHDNASMNVALAYIAANKDITQANNQAAIEGLRIQTQAQLAEDLINATANVALTQQQVNADILSQAIKEHRDISIGGVTLAKGAHSSADTQYSAYSLLSALGQNLGLSSYGGSTQTTSSVSSGGNTSNYGGITSSNYSPTGAITALA